MQHTSLLEDAIAYINYELKGYTDKISNLEKDI